VIELIEQFAQRAAEAGFTVHRGAVPQLEGAAISHAAYALADSGSVVLRSCDEPRAQSLLAYTHVTIVRTDTILPDLAALFAALGDDLPSSLAIVTGPSRSADIEQRLAVGVHGPGDVHVVLMDGGAA
jgi:L-lactate dehydrogenase complex protein LldG